MQLSIACPLWEGWGVMGIRQGGESNSPTPWADKFPTGHVSFELSVNLNSKSPMLGHELPAKY
jgi:hypothetical protein